MPRELTAGIVAAVLLGQTPGFPLNDAPKSGMVPESSADAPKALEFLAENQKEDGHWEPPPSEFKHLSTVHGKMEIGLTGACGLALLAEGSGIQEGKYRKNIQKAVEYLTRSIQAGGAFVPPGRTREPKKSHIANETPFAVYFLTQVYHETGSPELKEKLESVAKHIAKSQSPSGGWDYTYRLERHLHLPTVTSNLLALALLRRVGIPVGDSVIDRALQYISSVSTRNGNFKYGEERSSVTDRAAGVLVALAHLGRRDHALWDAAAAYHRKNFSRHIENGHSPAFQHFFIALASSLLGEKDWETYDEAFREHHLNAQKSDGHWECVLGRNDKASGHSHGGALFETAVRATVLQLSKGKLLLVNPGMKR
ncbi:MAG: terpene cyclase/mutase family protein [Planctomycetes bacterium]|nr:terpene cyclase/mutase family protein [Planctomycetota bacterium]